MGKGTRVTTDPLPYSTDQASSEDFAHVFSTAAAVTVDSADG